MELIMIDDGHCYLVYFYRVEDISETDLLLKLAKISWLLCVVCC